MIYEPEFLGKARVGTNAYVGLRAKHYESSIEVEDSDGWVWFYARPDNRRQFETWLEMVFATCESTAIPIAVGDGYRMENIEMGLTA